MKIEKWILVLGTLFCGLVGSNASAGGSPSQGTFPQERVSPTDGAGRQYMNLPELGYKVWESTSTGATNPEAQLTDELGNVVTNGQVHQVCISTGSTVVGVIAFDSATVSGLSVTSRYALAPQLMSAAATVTCWPQNLDVQFNNGIILLWAGAASVANGQKAYVYWRPSRGGRQ